VFSLAKYAGYKTVRICLQVWTMRNTRLNTGVHTKHQLQLEEVRSLFIIELYMIVYILVCDINHSKLRVSFLAIGYTVQQAYNQSEQLNTRISTCYIRRNKTRVSFDFRSNMLFIAKKMNFNLKYDI